MRTRALHLILLITLGAIFYLPFLGGVHLFDWDEINFAEISREMLYLGDFLRVHIDFQPFWEKPPLYFWMQAGAMSLLGVGEYAARLPNAINGMLVLVLIYLIGCRLYNPRFGMFWALVWLGSVLPFLYSKSGIIDPWFNLFIFGGLYLFILGYWQYRDGGGRPVLYMLLAGLTIGLAILTKGPVALLIAGLTMAVYWVMKRGQWYVPVWYFGVFILSASVLMLGWFGLETWKNGPWFVEEFIRYQYRLFSTPDAGHKGFPGYHFVVVLLGVFPASIFALRSFFPMETEREAPQNDFRLWMKILVWVVLILFSLVKSKIVHYSSMTYLPLTYLAAVVIWQWWEGRLAFNRWMLAGLWSIGLLYVTVSLALPWIGMHPEWLQDLVKGDPFALANLEAEVRWTPWHVLPGLWLLLILGVTQQYFRRADLRWGVPFLFIGVALYVQFTLIAVIRNIEGYTQEAAITFFEERQGEDVYVHPIGYKTYAHLYYTRRTPPDHPQARDQDWLLDGPVDKPVYFITRIHKTAPLEERPHIQEIGRRNGFVFYRREAAE
jgi:4-amino-4-deoxy-L-arabinose transferase-like glycosyltransferase